MNPLASLLGVLLFAHLANAVTVYGLTPAGFTATLSTPVAAATPTPGGGQIPNAAYDTTVLQPPTPPDNMDTKFTINLSATNVSVPNLSILQHGSFFGFSVETSVVTQLMGKNSTHLKPIFLNIISQLVQRSGGLHIRLGGNTQDFATLVDSIADGSATSKENTDPNAKTPSVIYTKDFFYLAANISSMVPGTRWYLGVPFNDTTNWRLQIAEQGQAILKDNLIGLQAGNEPDYYGQHGHRSIDYAPQDYFNEFGSLVKAMQANNNIPNKQMLIGPSLASGPWQPDQMWPTGFLDAYKDSLTAITMEHYPSNNCNVTYNVGQYVDPQKTFPSFLTHDAGLNLVKPYLDTSARAQAIGKPFIMFETNSATCGGLPGISDSFGATLWALDYGFTMAASNFSHALLHFGGQSTYYNPITAPPTNQSSFSKYTVGATLYPILVVGEAFGKSNLSQIVDTTTNSFTPSYAIYDNGKLDKVAFFNYVDDPSGAHDIVGTFTVNGGQVPSQVNVKYLAASSVSVKTNITWANQTFGNKFEVDGSLKGNLNIVTINCDTGANACNIPVKAPGFALVFLNSPSPDTTATPTTFATTAYTKLVNTATIDPSVLATSNGMSGKERQMQGSTSPGSSGAHFNSAPVFLSFVAMAATAILGVLTS